MSGHLSQSLTPQEGRTKVKCVAVWSTQAWTTVPAQPAPCPPASWILETSVDISGRKRAKSAVSLDLSLHKSVLSFQANGHPTTASGGAPWNPEGLRPNGGTAAQLQPCDRHMGMLIRGYQLV